jgi:adenylate cyclase
MAPAKLRDLAVVAVIAAVAAVGFASGPAAAWLRGPSLDLLMPLRHWLLPAPAKPSHVAVVAIDEETYRRQPFNETPQATWLPLLAPVVNAVAGEAAVVGFDVVYSTSLDTIQRGFERDFLIALRNAARAGKLVLGKVQHSAFPILPHAAQQVAVGGAANIRPLNVFEDDDGVIRRVPLAFANADGTGEAGFAAELAQRAAGGTRVAPRGDADGNLLLNFNTAAGAIPTYSLADLHACAQAGKTEYFQRHFAGRVVIFATVLDVEDRRLTSRRLVQQADGAAAPSRCVHPVMPLAAVARDSTPGVYIHATAVDNILDGTALRDWPAAGSLAAALVFTALSALAVFYLPLAAGLAASGAVALALAPGAALLLQAGGVAPWLGIAAAMVTAAAATVAYRFAVADRDRRLIGKLFSLYLPPVVIARMVAGGRMPVLGGEEREVTVLFSDIAGFTTISEACDPATLVQGLNTYFSTMTAIIEDHGGFVDKYIGDAIVAVFGAPVDDGRHADHAIRAALKMRDALHSDPQRFSVAGHVMHTRIGLNTGRVLIGNIGSPRRFNYTAMGDAVNLASRLEGANKAYGTSILVSDATMSAAGDATIVARMIDTVRVVGRAQPVRLFEPLARHGRADIKQQAAADSFARAHAALAYGDRNGARAALQGLDDDKAAALFLKRIAALPEDPAQWSAVRSLTEK